MATYIIFFILSFSFWSTSYGFSKPPNSYPFKDFLEPSLERFRCDGHRQFSFRHGSPLTDFTLRSSAAAAETGGTDEQYLDDKQVILYSLRDNHNFRYHFRYLVNFSCAIIQLDFIKAYLNEHHKSDVIIPLVIAFSPLGTIAVKKNMWMAGSFTVNDAELVDITRDELHIEATVQDGRKTSQERVPISLDSDPVQGMIRTYPTLPKLDPFVLDYASKIPVDNFVRRMIRLCNIVKAHAATGKMIQLGVQMGGKGVGKLVGRMNHNNHACP